MTGKHGKLWSKNFQITKTTYFFFFSDDSVEFIFQQSCGPKDGKMYLSTEHKSELTEEELQVLQSTPFKMIRHEWKKKAHQGLLCMKTKSSTLGSASL